MGSSGASYQPRASQEEEEAQQPPQPRHGSRHVSCFGSSSSITTWCPLRPAGRARMGGSIVRAFAVVRFELQCRASVTVAVARDETRYFVCGSFLAVDVLLSGA